MSEVAPEDGREENEPYEYPSNLDDLHAVFEQLSRMRVEVADKIASIEGDEVSVRKGLLSSAITIGRAGTPDDEMPGVAHLLAMSPTLSELKTLLPYVTEMNRIAMSNRREPESDWARISELESSLHLGGREVVVMRAIEIVEDLDKWGILTPQPSADG